MLDIYLYYIEIYIIPIYNPIYIWIYTNKYNSFIEIYYEELSHAVWRINSMISHLQAGD